MALLALYGAIAFVAGAFFGPFGVAIAMGIVIAIHLYTFERKTGDPIDSSGSEIDRFSRGTRQFLSEVFGVILVLGIGFVVLSGLLAPGSCSRSSDFEQEYRAP